MEGTGGVSAGRLGPSTLPRDLCWEEVASGVSVFSNRIDWPRFGGFSDRLHDSLDDLGSSDWLESWGVSGLFFCGWLDGLGFSE